MNITIKEATLENLKNIINLNQQLFEYDYQFDNTWDCKWPKKNEWYYKESITKKDRLAIIAVVNDRVVGYLIAGFCELRKDHERTVSKIAELENMFVIPNNRSKGVGKLLCEKFFEWANKNKAERIKVATSIQNKGAIKFYQKLGFKDRVLTLEKEP